jgi:hypothetical protein
MAPNKSLLPDNFSTASLLQNCRKALRWVCMNKIGHLAIVTLIVSGCAGISSVRYSKPTLEAGVQVTAVQEKYVGEMYSINGIAYHVYPVNGARKDLMLFPFPLPTSTPASSIPPFVVGIALKASVGAYSFEPSLVEYWSSNVQRIYPTRIKGPYPCDSQQPRPAWKPASEVAVQLSLSCSYMWLEFQITPPDPSQTFFVKVGGVRLAERDIVLPTVHFKEATRTETFAVP